MVLITEGGNLNLINKPLMVFYTVNIRLRRVEANAYSKKSIGDSFVPTEATIRQSLFNWKIERNDTSNIIIHFQSRDLCIIPY